MDNLIESSRVLLKEAGIIGHLVITNYFPTITDFEDLTCPNCQSYRNCMCSGKQLDFDGIIKCMVNKVINGTDNRYRLITKMQLQEEGSASFRFRIA